MRGGRSKTRRAEAQPAYPANEATGVMVSVAAPVGGWNAKDALAMMGPTDAITLDNFFPSTSDVQLRPGRVDWATGLTGNARAFLPYNSQTTQQLFCATTSGIYNVTGAGAVGAAVTTCTNGQWESVNFTNAGGSFLLAVNGVDNAKTYNGTVWADSTITGVAINTLTNVFLHKRRIWMLANNSMTAWYLGTDAIAGAATAFPMGGIFTRGGYLVAQMGWTVDGGAGVDAYWLTVTSEGEIAIYQGTDPASASTWSLVGVYYLGVPIGKKCFCHYGGDVLFLSQLGLIPISRFLMATQSRSSGAPDESISVSFNIDGAFRASSLLYGSVFGWGTIFFPNVNALIVNVPQSVDGLTNQYVMNSITKSWCSFSGWASNCQIVFKSELYQASGTKTFKSWTGLSDSGIPITGTAQTAYNKLKYSYQKQVALVRPNIAIDNAATLSLAFDSDFRVFGGSGSISTYSVSTGSSLWGTGIWNTSTWGAGSIPIASAWATVPNTPGYLQSFRLQLTTSSSKFSWTSTDFIIRKAGVL